MPEKVAIAAPQVPVQRSGKASLKRTLLTSGVFGAVAVLMVSVLTKGFQAWTFEDRRILSMQAGNVGTTLPLLLTPQEKNYAPMKSEGSPLPVHLVNFIYTSCPTVCQVLGSEFYQMQQYLKQSGQDDRIKLLSISIDKQRDGAEQLSAYAKQHQADGHAWVVGVPLLSKELQRLLHDLQVIAVSDGLGGYVHNGDIHLLNGNGKLMGLYAYGQWQQALTHAQTIAQLAP